VHYDAKAHMEAANASIGYTESRTIDYRLAVQTGFSVVVEGAPTVGATKFRNYRVEGISVKTVVTRSNCHTLFQLYLALQRLVGA